MRNFDEWLKTLKESISTYDYYVDFNKVFLNVESIKIELNILNSLIGSKNIENDFELLVTKYPETIKCIPILLAVRENEIRAMDSQGEFIYKFSNNDISINQLKYFMKETGLFGLIQNHIVNNLYDYVTGVETGLSSNGRKNRGGHLMENLLEDYLKNTY